MSFFSGHSGNLASQGQRPLGLEPRRLSTNEQARPVPLLYGRDRIGVTFITEAFSPRATEVKQDVPKKAEDVVTGWNYYASFAGLICHGPIDAVRGIFFDGQKVWPISGSGIVRDGSNPDYAPITIEGWGTWRLYWGTESQGIDATLADLALLSEPIKHPAYKGFAYFVALDQFLGYQSNKVPLIEVEVERYLENHFGVGGEYSAWLTGRTIGQDINPLVAAVDMLVSSRYGLGLRDVASNDTTLNRSAIQAAADVLGSESLGVSRSIDRQQAFDQVLVTLLETIDGWHAWDADGKIRFGLNRPLPNGTSLPVLDEKAIIGEPTLRNPALSSVATEVALKYTNAQNDFAEDVVRASNAWASRRIPEPNIETLDRPWIRNPNTALKMVHAAAKVLGKPRVTGAITVRKSRLQGIGPGSRFLLHWDQWDLCNLPCVATAIGVQDPFKSAVDIEWEVDRAALGKLTYTPATYVAPVRTVHAAPKIDHLRVIEAPYRIEARNVDAVRIGAMVMRPDTADGEKSIATGWRLSYALAGGSYESLVRSGGVWSLHGTLAADYSASASGQIQLILATPQIPADCPDVAAADAAKDYYLLCIAKSDGLDEWMAVHSKDVTASPIVKYSVLRERMDTGKRAHTAGDEWFLFSPSSLFQPSQLGDPIGGAAEASTISVKAQSVLLGRLSDIAEADVKTLTIRERAKRPWKPKSVLCSATTYNNTSTVTLSWTPAHKDGDGNKGSNMPGVEWVVEVRASSADPASPPIISKSLAYTATGYTFPIGAIGSALGNVAARITVLAQSGQYQSLNKDEFILPYT